MKKINKSKCLLPFLNTALQTMSYKQSMFFFPLTWAKKITNENLAMLSINLTKRVDFEISQIQRQRN